MVLVSSFEVEKKPESDLYKMDPLATSHLVQNGSYLIVGSQPTSEDH